MTDQQERINMSEGYNVRTCANCGREKGEEEDNCPVCKSVEEVLVWHEERIVLRLKDENKESAT